MGFDERARAESGRGVEPGVARPDDGHVCGERFGTEPQTGSQASEEVPDRWSGRDPAQGARSGSNNRIDPAVREFAVTLVRENYIDFGPTFAAEKLEEDHGLKVSRETLRKWMQDAGIWLSRKQRRTFHQPRLRRECYGELIQIDGSDHHWFEDRGPCPAPCSSSSTMPPAP